MAKSKKVPTAAELADFQRKAVAGIKKGTQHEGMQANPYLNMLEKLKSMFGSGAFEEKE